MKKVYQKYKTNYENKEKLSPGDPLCDPLSLFCEDSNGNKSYLILNLHWKLMIDLKLRVDSQISRPANIPKKWFSTQNGPLDVSFQMRLTPNYRSFLFLEKLN